MILLSVYHIFIVSIVIVLFFSQLSVSYITNRLLSHQKLYQNPILPFHLYDVSGDVIQDYSSAVVEEDIDVKILPNIKLPIFNRNRLLISINNPFGEKITSKEDAINELISLCNEINRFEIILDQQYRLEYIISYLESTYIPIQTIPFLNMAIDGKWLKVYSNLITPRACIDLEYKIFQTIHSDPTKIMSGNITETIQWKYTEQLPSDICHSSGTLDVLSTYSINSKGDLNVDLEEHILQAEAMPNNIEEFLVNVQRSIPFDSFDNNMTTHSITYIDPKLRITRVSGDKFLDVFNIFLKQ